MINLISKINDRNIQRKRESGLTGYVLISGLAICFYKLFKHLEFLLTDSVFEIKNLNESIELIFYTYNALVCSGIIVYQLFPNLKTLNHIKFLKKDKTESYVFLSMSLMYSFGTILVVYVFFTKKNPQAGFNLYCIFLFLIYLFGWFAFALLIKNNKSKVLKLNSDPKRLRNIILIIMFSTSIIIAIISNVYIYGLDVEYKSQIIKILILTYLSYAIIEKILEVNSNDLFYSKLEAFEYEIKLRDLTDNALIKKEFQERFSGFLVNDWIQNQIKLVEFRILTFNENIEHINYQITEIGNKRFTDKESEHKLKHKLEEERSFHLYNYKEACREHKMELEKSLNNNYYGFDELERSQINNLIKILKNEL